MLKISYTAIYTWKNYLCKSLFLCFLFFSGGLTVQASTGPIIEKHKVLDFDLVDGLIIIKATYEGAEGNFILDTGAPRLLLNQEVKQKSFDLWTTKGLNPGKEISVGDFQCGMINKENVEGWAMDLSYLEDQMDIQLAGIMGNDLWEGHQVIIDFVESKIRFYEKGDVAAFSSDNYHVASLSWTTTSEDHRVVELEINGTDRQMSFDTGAGISVIDDTMVQNVEEKGAARLSHILVQDLPFIKSDLSELNKASSDTIIHGIISATSLNASILVLDYPNNRVHIGWDKSSF